MLLLRDRRGSRGGGMMKAGRFHASRSVLRHVLGNILLDVGVIEVSLLLEC